MTRIRVDTEELKSKAKDFAASADAVGRAGDEILATAMSLPSYDGQLSGPARKAGYDIQSQTRALKANLAGDAESLTKTAQDFEMVDNRAVDALSASQASLLYAPLGRESADTASGDGYPHFPYDRMVTGSDISYEYQPEKKTVVIFYKGKFYTLPFDPDDPSVPPEPYRGIIEKIIHNCDDIEVASTNLDGDLLLAGFGVLPVIGDIALVASIIWQTLRDKNIDWYDIGQETSIEAIKVALEAEGKKAIGELIAPILGTIAAIPSIRDDFEDLANAYNEAPSFDEIHRLFNPDNGVVISVTDDIVDHNGFSPAPVPQDPQATSTPAAPSSGVGAAGGSTATPSTVPSPTQTPIQTPTPNTTPTNTPENPTPSQTPSQTPTPSSTPTGTPTSPYQTTTPDPTGNPTQTLTPPKK